MILLDTHALLWARSDPGRLSDRGRALLAAADAVGVAGVTWYELAWLAEAGRIQLAPDVAAWVESASVQVTTLPCTAEIARAAAALESASDFPRDPFDRLIYSTAVHHGASLLTRDGPMQTHDPETCLW